MSQQSTAHTLQISHPTFRLVCRLRIACLASPLHVTRADECRRGMHGLRLQVVVIERLAAGQQMNATQDSNNDLIEAQSQLNKRLLHHNE
jgi:hypothetical protein